MANYDVYALLKHRASQTVHYYRLDKENGVVEDWRSYRIIDGKPAYKWQRSRLSPLALIERCHAPYWFNNGCGATLVAKNVRFKNV